jgi:hypothetical protein
VPAPAAGPAGALLKRGTGSRRSGESCDCASASSRRMRSLAAAASFSLGDCFGTGGSITIRGEECFAGTAAGCRDAERGPSESSDDADGAGEGASRRSMEPVGSSAVAAGSSGGAGDGGAEGEGDSAGAEIAMAVSACSSARSVGCGDCGGTESVSSSCAGSSKEAAASVSA